MFIVIVKYAYTDRVCAQCYTNGSRGLQVESFNGTGLSIAIPLPKKVLRGGDFNVFLCFLSSAAFDQNKTENRK